MSTISLESAATKQRILAELRDEAGQALTLEQQVRVLVLWGLIQHHAGRSFAAFAPLAAGRDQDLSLGFFDRTVARYGLDLDDQMTLLLAYCDELPEGGRSFAEFAAAILEPEGGEETGESEAAPWEEPAAASAPLPEPPPAPPQRSRKKKPAAEGAPRPLPGQQLLPLDGAAAEPPAPAPKTKKPQNLTGKRASCRKGKARLVGTVERDDGTTVDFVDEKGNRHEGIPRGNVTKLKPLEAPAAAAEPAGPRAPDVVITIPPREMARLGKLLAREEPVAKAGPDESLAYFSAEYKGHTVSLEVYNGTPGQGGPYADIYVNFKGSTPTFTHPPIRTLPGRYPIEVRRKPVLLEIGSG